MFGMKLHQAKSAFFDRAKVQRAMDAGTRRVLSKFGAYVRTTARSSIRWRRRVSRPGEPPSSHVGILRRLILFGYDAARQSVVIGPARINQRSAYASHTVPEVLEYGATVQARDRGGPGRTLRYKARPFIGPAYEKELPGLSAMWRDSVR